MNKCLFNVNKISLDYFIRFRPLTLSLSTPLVPFERHNFLKSLFYTRCKSWDIANDCKPPLIQIGLSFFEAEKLGGILAPSITSKLLIATSWNCGIDAIFFNTQWHVILYLALPSGQIPVQTQQNNVRRTFNRTLLYSYFADFEQVLTHCVIYTALKRRHSTKIYDDLCHRDWNNWNTESSHVIFYF